MGRDVLIDVSQVRRSTAPIPPENAPISCCADVGPPPTGGIGAQLPISRTDPYASAPRSARSRPPVVGDPARSARLWEAARGRGKQGRFVATAGRNARRIARDMQM